MRYVLIALLIVALLLGILGFIIEAALWIGFIGLVLFVGTIAFWVIRAKIRNRGGNDIESQ